MRKINELRGAAILIGRNDREYTNSIRIHLSRPEVR